MNARNVTFSVPTQRWTLLRWAAVPLAMLLATAANVLFYYLLTRLLHEPLLMKSEQGGLSAMAVSDVMLFSLFWSFWAGMVWLVVLAASKRPVRTFVLISAAVLVISIFLPLKIPTPPVALTAKLSLAAMHVIGFVVVVGALTTLGRPPQSKVN